MLQFCIIGNIGSDAQVKEDNGRKFVSFNVGHNDRWTDENGVNHEQTIWVSCAMSGDGGNLLPYLKKGRAVYVSGRGSARIYSSPTLKRMVAGLNISVDRVELIGANPDPVPRELYTHEGIIVRTNKAFYADQDTLKTLKVNSKSPDTQLIDRSNNAYLLNNKGWIVPASTQPQSDEQQP